MEEEKQLTGQESLELISRMIHEGQNYFHESGIATLIWGFSIAVCGALSFLMTRGLRFPFDPFYFMIIAMIVQTYFYAKEEKKKIAKTFTDEAIDYVWSGFFVSVIILVVAGVIAGIAEYMVVTISLFLTALASFFTGMITKFRFMIFASFACWLIAGTCLLVQNEYVYLLLSLAAVFIWIIPGFMMNAYLKQIQHGRRKTLD